MQAVKIKRVIEKSGCDRCGQKSERIDECSFSFRHPLRYWKEVYRASKSRRLTNRRKAAFEEELSFDWRTPPVYYLDLCGSCWEATGQPFDGWPVEFYEQRLEHLAPAASGGAG